MARFLRSLHLKTRIVLVVVTLMLAAVWASAIHVMKLMQAQLEEEFSTQLATVVRFAAEDMDRDVDTRFEALKRIAGAITPEILADSHALQDFLERRQMVRAIFDMNLMVVDKDGTIRADYPLAAERIGRSLSDRPYFREAMSTGQPVIGEPVIGNLSKRPFVPIAIPLRDASGTVNAVLIDRVLLSESHPFGQLQEIRLGRSGWFLVVSPKSRMVIAATDGKRVMTRLPGRGAIPLLDRRLEEGYEGVGVTVASTGEEVLSVARKMASTGWVVLGTVPTGEIFASIKLLEQQIFIAALLASILIAVLLRWFLTREFARLDNASEAMRRMTQGEAPLAPIPVGRDDEIGRLQHNFNRLVLERNRLDEALRQEIGGRKQAQKELNQAMTRLQLLSQRATKTHEDRQQEIASELHEQLGQDLATLNLNLHMLKAHTKLEQPRVLLDSAHELAGSMLQRIRSMAMDLRPPLLDDFGLYAALRTYCTQQAKSCGWRLRFDAPESGERPHRDVEIACFRLVQEALDNVARHANATEVRVEITAGHDEFRVRVRDNGTGFDTDAAHQHVGQEALGLVDMEERVRHVNGRLEIESYPGAGAEIRAIFPACSAFPETLCHPTDSARCASCNLNPQVQ